MSEKDCNTASVSRRKTRLSRSEYKNGFTGKKGHIGNKSQLSPSNEVKGDSLLNADTVHSTEFLETLNLKSKGKIIRNGSVDFNSGVFISDDTSSSNSPSCKAEDKENHEESTFCSLIQEPVNASVTSEKLNTKQNRDSLGKTLAFSLQLIAAGDANIMPQLNSPSACFSPKEMKNETPEDSSEEPVELKETSPPIRSRYITRSTLSCDDHNGTLFDINKHKKLMTDKNQDLITSDNQDPITSDKDLTNYDSSVTEDKSGKQPVVARKRGRRRKEEITCAVSKGNMYVCSQCGKAFNKSQTLRQHFITHTDRFACSFCNVRCKSKGDLRSHTQTHTKEKPFQCEVCNTFYTRESILKKHKLTQLHKNACFQLGNQLQRALKADIRSSVGRRPKSGTFSCQHCSKIFSAKQKLKQHLKVHNYKFSCLQCHKRCKSALMLSIHKRCHLQPDSLPCKFCSRVFTNLRVLAEHTKTAHSFIYWRRKFPGNLWKSLLTQKVDCIADLKSELQSIKSAGQFVCKICPRNFKSKKAFEKHCAKHAESHSSSPNVKSQSTGRKMSKYHCSECTKSFTHFDEFSKHHTDLHREKPMICHICYNTFDNPSEFKSHVHNHGPTMLFSGASLEESKIPYVHKRNRRSNLYESGSVTKLSDDKHHKGDFKEENLQDDDEFDDEIFLESREFLLFLSTAFNDDSDGEKEDDDDDEELYTGIRTLLYDSDQDSAVINNKISSDNTILKKKMDNEMKMFFVQDEENNFYKCSPCNTLFISSGQLKVHMESHICVPCNTFFQNKEDLSEHYDCQDKESKIDEMKTETEKPVLDSMSDLQSDDATFVSDDEMNEVFLDELEGILDYENKSNPSVDFLNTFSHDEIIKTNKKIFERYSCIDVPTNIYACIICKRKYARPTTLTRHFKTHVCHYCNTFFVDKSDLTDHKYKHKKKAAMIKAEISGECASKVLRSPLVSKVNRELFKKFTIVDSSRNVNKCCLCDKLFVRKTVLTRHMKTHVCSYCDKFFEDKYELARHVSLHKIDPHIPEDDPVHRQYPVFDQEKPFDPSTFSNQLEEESKMVAIGSSYSSSLPQFTTTFSTPSTNSNETVTFIQIPATETCSDPNTVTFGPGVAADTPTYQILSDPIVQNQGSYIVTPQNCHRDDGNKIITLTQDHLLPGNRCSVETTDLFECNICSKTFFKSGHLKSHISTHTAPAPFACRYCGKTFVRNGPLRKHEKTHNVKRCNHCDMSFTCQFELDHHMQIHESYPFYK